MPEKLSFGVEIDDLAAVLKQNLAGDVHFDQMTRLLYSTDASNYQIEPIGVVFPRDADDVVATHTLAGAAKVPLLPRGGGSSLAGQTVGHAIVMDFSRYMGRILGINAEAQTVQVQPGMVLGHLNQQLAALGLMVGPDPASADRATVGGCLGNNATGMHSILYGMFGDHITEVDAVLADGERVAFGLHAPDHSRRRSLRATVTALLDEYAVEIDQGYPKTWRSVAGYALNTLDRTNLNLARLFAGAEGTLGTVVALGLGLVERPAHTQMALLHFDDMQRALESVPALLQTEPSAIELMDKMLLDMTRKHPDYSRLLTFVDGDPAAILVVEYAGNTEAECTAKLSRLRDHLAVQHFSGPVVVATRDTEMSSVLKVRKAGLGLLMSMRGDFKPVPLIEDAAVPVENLANYVEAIEQLIAENGARMAIYAHASAGCLHIRPLLNLKSAEGLRQYRAIAEGAAELVMSFGGTTSGEHGEGLTRGEFSQKLFGPELTQAFRRLKAAFDPDNLMNPGKVVDVGPLDDPGLLRFGPDYHLSHDLTQTRFAWAADGSFAGAVEMCNGAAVCRKEGAGVMCPSYMATRDEAHSTRGRANALRLAMTGALGSDGLGDGRVYEVLDLCLSCKACKAECPSLVDMARLKAEFTAQYHDRHGVPLRSWVFGHIHRLNQLGSIAPPVSNVVLTSRPGRWAFSRLGVTPNRQMPLFARQRFSRSIQRQNSTSRISQSARSAPILIADTYTEYNYPSLGHAAIRLMQAAGCKVDVWGPKQIDCCGRPLISKGLLDDARKLAVRNVRRMVPRVVAGERFMLIEPSCAAAYRDEYPDLVPANMRADAQRAAGAVLSVEEWLAEAVSKGWLDPEHFDPVTEKILLHGHCYQRALWGTSAAHQMLSVVPGAVVTELDDGCCGVAGSFGYEAEHYDLSVQIGEQRLLPAVRSNPDAVILASGVSCREQIAHGTAREALHPIEFLAAHLRR